MPDIVLEACMHTRMIPPSSHQPKKVVIIILILQKRKLKLKMVHITDREQSQDLNRTSDSTNLIELYIIDHQLYIIRL